MKGPPGGLGCHFIKTHMKCYIVTFWAPAAFLFLNEYVICLLCTSEARGRRIYTIRLSVLRGDGGGVYGLGLPRTLISKAKKPFWETYVAYGNNIT